MNKCFLFFLEKLHGTLQGWIFVIYVKTLTLNIIMITKIYSLLRSKKYFFSFEKKMLEEYEGQAT